MFIALGVLGQEVPPPRINRCVNFGTSSPLCCGMPVCSTSTVGCTIFLRNQPVINTVTPSSANPWQASTFASRFPNSIFPLGRMLGIDPILYTNRTRVVSLSCKVGTYNPASLNPVIAMEDSGVINSALQIRCAGELDNVGFWELTSQAQDCLKACPPYLPPADTNITTGNCSTSSMSVQGKSCIPGCAAGNQATTPLLATCGDEGQWTTEGECEPRCPPYPPPAGFTVGNCPVNFFAPYGTTCSPGCQTGVATSTATCEGGVWVTTGACACQLPAPTVNRATALCVTGSSFPSGSACSYTCDEGFSGTVRASCLAGVWSVSGQCRSTNCSTLPPVVPNTNGLRSCQGGPNNPPFEEGQTCKYDCADSFGPTEGKGPVYTCRNRVWVLSGSCQPLCGPLVVLPMYKQNTPNRGNPGEAYPLQCANRFSPCGANAGTSTCLNGNWTCPTGLGCFSNTSPCPAVNC